MRDAAMTIYTYRDGKKTECLCVVLQGGFPPTDSLIMRYLMILNDENGFRALANKQSIAHVAPQIRKIDLRPLSQIFAELKSGSRIAA